MTHPSRDLFGLSQARGIRDLLQSLFVAELLNPSPRLWLLFAWLSDVEVVDNAGRRFATLAPDWPAAPVRLTQVLDALLTRGSEVSLVIRADGHNDYVLARLRTLRERHGQRLRWAVAKDFHAKGMLGADYVLSGSMNLTRNGITVNGEHLVFRTDPAVVAEQALEMELQWGRLLA